MESVRAQLVSLLGSLGRPLPADWDDDRALDLASIEVVMLHEAIEDGFGVRLEVTDVTRETFGTLGALARLIAARSGR